MWLLRIVLYSATRSFFMLSWAHKWQFTMDIETPEIASLMLTAPLLPCMEKNGKWLGITQFKPPGQRKDLPKYHQGQFECTASPCLEL